MDEEESYFPFLPYHEMSPVKSNHVICIPCIYPHKTPLRGQVLWFFLDYSSKLYTFCLGLSWTECLESA